MAGQGALRPPDMGPLGQATIRPARRATTDSNVYAIFVRRRRAADEMANPFYDGFFGGLHTPNLAF